ncbi:MAG: hypothetical protein ACI9LT_002440, partial [Pseudoalteromonas distincta]
GQAIASSVYKMGRNRVISLGTWGSLEPNQGVLVYKNAPRCEFCKPT